MTTGVSIVICCYNSAQRLPQTLAHLAAQEVTSELLWEVLVIDNACTDNTKEVATSSWPKESSVPLRVIDEPQPGLSHARHRGFIEAKYELISFVDDDNWVCPEWVQTVAEIMSEHPEVGACGGCSKAVSEVALPWWFSKYQDTYAVGEQTKEVGDVTQTRGFLWGAGLTIRKQAWEQLQNRGFKSILTGRKGAVLSAGEDHEFCLALRLAGWHIWYDPRLQFCHFIPASRLQWNYLRRLKRGFGAGSVGLDPYFFALKKDSSWLKRYIEKSWFYRMAAVLLKLLPYSYKWILSSYSPLEGDADILNLEILQGRLSQLLISYKIYGVNIKQFQDTPERNLLID
ncbi:MAG: glycosyltransferase family 2 protein [Cyanomargarita calcarea GSE-NOS-MK-12-04C]|jgi:glycosyltransferase involved in cell wall biosynthesis|uniref:Glycosyltransferase family 2 protein n=1 Tax=Cyanomargarita calcarea GSE-NOS-MK-12-04C TaxID=2839659 RepID=A0A951QN53_9CYAN|nr:glycosyltransferase family 2 protein [Cyanomargarita calcarea GSE-NOS-MK-12-04C]